MGHAFVGSWKFSSSDKFDEYLEAAGVNMAMRKLAGTVKPDLDIKILNGEWTITNSSKVKTVVFKFKLDSEFNEETPDGRKVTCKCTLESPTKLVQHQKDAKQGKESVITREVKGDVMTVTLVCGSAKAVREYTKA